MIRAILLAGASALAVAASALATAATPDPVTLALQRSDLPAKIFPSAAAQRLEQHEVADLGVSGLKAASYSYSWPAPGNSTGSGSGMTWYLFGYVFVAPNEAGAQKIYHDATKLRFGLPEFEDLRYPPVDQQAVVSLPSYGNEYLGIVGTHAGPEATLYVRRGAVVWGLSIGHGPTAWKVSKAQVIAQLKLYAHKQAARISGGG